ncbi:hypothetical protein [Paraliobacillus sediminis]|uniref:hypothetical protein n=1 Tax=Paraliobacillus sediminis TaxID=1885916 RepID=UPI000E3EB3DF|nr:hypothetical protein [Paraliobacillus sediminis]
MRFEMPCTEIDTELEKRIIKVYDHQEKVTIIYYEDEIEDIAILALKLFIKERIDPINMGVYDVPSL